MNRKLLNKYITALFCAAIFAAPVLFFLLPKQRLSEREKRVLAEKPALSAASVLWNSTPNGFWDKPVVHPGAYGAQVGLINRYENGGGLQMGFWNNSNESETLQGGIINGMYDHAYGTQFGIVNLMFGGSCGLQVGLINAIVEDSKGVQVGLLNMRVMEKKSFSPLVGWRF